MALLGAACSSDGSSDAQSDTTTTTDGYPSTCAAAVDEIVDATDRYVEGYEDARDTVIPVSDADETTLTPSTQPTVATTPDGVLDEEGYQGALATAQGSLEERGCDPLRARVDLVRSLQEIEADGAVADAVLRQVVASMAGTAGTTATTVEADVDEDLRALVSTLAPGSTLRLAAGEHRLDGTLVLLAGIEIVGAGREVTTIATSAPDAGVLAITDEVVIVRDLTVEHVGDAPASVVLGGPAASVVVEDAEVRGGRADAEGQGGAGVLMFATSDLTESRGTTLELTDVVLSDNDSGGVVLSGRHRISAVRPTITGSGQCGICFLDSSDGSVEDGRFDDNAVGIVATGRATPLVRAAEVSGGEVGIQIADDAAPLLESIEIVGSAQAGSIFSGRARGRLDGIVCRDVPFGIVFGPGVAPDVGQIDCDVHRSAD